MQAASVVADSEQADVQGSTVLKVRDCVVTKDGQISVVASGEHVPTYSSLVC